MPNKTFIRSKRLADSLDTVDEQVHLLDQAAYQYNEDRARRHRWTKAVKGLIGL